MRLYVFAVADDAQCIGGGSDGAATSNSPMLDALDSLRLVRVPLYLVPTYSKRLRSILHLSKECSMRRVIRIIQSHLYHAPLLPVCTSPSGLHVWPCIRPSARPWFRVYLLWRRSLLHAFISALSLSVLYILLLLDEPSSFLRAVLDSRCAHHNCIIHFFHPVPIRFQR